MSYEAEAWQHLIDFLNTWCRASARPGAIDVSLPMPGGHSRKVVIVMTPHQLDGMVSVMGGGDFDRVAQSVRGRLLQLGPAERYLVFGDYELNPSTTPEWP